MAVELFPSRPLSPWPQHLMTPAVVATQEWLKPEARALRGVEIPETVPTGTLLFVVEVFPSCPVLFVPQHETVVPLPVMAQL